MDFFVGVLLGGVLGYALRGSIGRELKVIGADVKAEFAKLVAEAKAKL